MTLEVLVVMLFLERMGASKEAGTVDKGVFPVIIQAGEDGKYVASCPAIDGCFSQGDSVSEAAANIREAIALCIEEMETRGQTPPHGTSTFLTEVTV